MDRASALQPFLHSQDAAGGLALVSLVLSPLISHCPMAGLTPDFEEKSPLPCLGGHCQRVRSLVLQNFYLYFFGLSFNTVGLLAVALLDRRPITSLFHGHSKVTATLYQACIAAI